MAVAAALVGVGVWPFAAADAWSVLPAGIAMVFGVAAGLGLLALLPPRPLSAWAMPLLAAGGLRIGAGVAGALWAYFAFDPARLVFWGGLLACGVAALIAESAAAMTVFRSAGAGPVTTDNLAPIGAA